MTDPFPVSSLTIGSNGLPRVLSSSPATQREENRIIHRLFSHDEALCRH